MLVLAAVVAACGGGGSSSTGTTAGPVGPGAGKPPVTIGTKNFPEAFLLGQLYAQALEAKGFKVKLKSDVGATEIIYRALMSGTLDMYPDYTGVVVAVVGNVRRTPPSEQAAFRLARRVVTRDGLVLLDPTPFVDRDAIAVMPALARRYHLRTLVNLANVPGKVTIAGPPEFKTREQGFVGLRDLYKLDRLEFRPFKIGDQYAALSRGVVEAADVFTTDGQLKTGDYVVLRDPQRLFGFQNAVPLVRKPVLTREGPAFAQTINAVSAALTTPEMQRMNAAVVLAQNSPASVADDFLRSHRLK